MPVPWSILGIFCQKNKPNVGKYTGAMEHIRHIFWRCKGPFQFPTSIEEVPEAQMRLITSFW